LGVQGHSRSSMLTPLKKLVSIACYDKPHVCNRFHATPANSGKITTF